MLFLPALASRPCKVETVILHRCVQPLLHAIHSSNFLFVLMHHLRIQHNGLSCHAFLENYPSLIHAQRKQAFA